MIWVTFVDFDFFLMYVIRLVSTQAPAAAGYAHAVDVLPLHARCKVHHYRRIGSLFNPSDLFFNLTSSSSKFR